MPSLQTFLTVIMHVTKVRRWRDCRREGAALPTFEIVNSLAVQDPNPVLESRLATAKKIHDIPQFLRCLLLLFGGRHVYAGLTTSLKLTSARIRDEIGAHV
jgi:hypothetical protein